MAQHFGPGSPYTNNRRYNQDHDKYNNPQSSGRGVMRVFVLMASGIKGDSLNLFENFKASPYVRMKHGHDKKELKSSIHRGGGSTPMWNEVLVYNIPNPPRRSPLLSFEIWNYHHTRKDNLLGRVSIANLEEYISNHPQGTEYLWLPIFYIGEKSTGVQHRGNLLVRFYFEVKDDEYFGQGQYEKDHTAKFSQMHGQSKCVDIPDVGIFPQIEILENVPVEKLAGTVIKLVI